LPVTLGGLGAPWTSYREDVRDELKRRTKRSLNALYRSHDPQSTPPTVPRGFIGRLTRFIATAILSFHRKEDAGLYARTLQFLLCHSEPSCAWRHRD
jgi:hypothetical protein